MMKMQGKYENLMTDQSAILPGKQATTAWEPAKGGDNGTVPHRVACQELIGENGRGCVLDIRFLYSYKPSEKLKI